MVKFDPLDISKDSLKSDKGSFKIPSSIIGKFSQLDQIEVEVSALSIFYIFLLSVFIQIFLFL